MHNKHQARPGEYPEVATTCLAQLSWHMTDDQGWRLPVPGYPRLTTVGAGSLDGAQDQPVTHRDLRIARLFE